MKTPKITSEEIGIIKKAQAGDKLAFTHLFNKYKTFVEKVLFAYIKDKDESADIANIVFLKAYEKLSSFQDYSSFGGWLRIIARHTAIDYLRKMKDENDVLRTEELLPGSYEPSNNMENDLINQFTYQRILKEFDKFKEPIPRICRLFYEDNLTIEDIAKKLSIPIGTIKSILFRTRNQLRKQLKID